MAAAALETVRQSGAAAPRLLRLEIVNLLITNERRGRMMEAETSAFLTALSRLPISLDERGRRGIWPWPGAIALPLTTPPTWNWPTVKGSRWPHWIET